MVGVLVHREDAEPEGQGRAAEALDPDPHPHPTDPRHGPEVLDLVGAHEVKAVIALVEAPSKHLHPEGSERPLEQEQVSGVVEDVKGIQVVEIDPHHLFVEALGHIVSMRVYRSPYFAPAGTIPAEDGDATTFDKPGSSGQKTAPGKASLDPRPRSGLPSADGAFLPACPPANTLGRLRAPQRDATPSRIRPEESTLRTLSVLFVLALSACGAPPAATSVPGALTPTGAPVATVNGQAITEGMLEIVTSNIPPQQLEQMKARGEYNNMIEQIAIGEVLYLNAIEQKLHERPEVQMAAAMASRNAIAREFLDSIGEKAVTEEAVAAKYAEQSVRYAKPQVKASHILVKDAELAASLKAQIDGGADFAALAQEHSVDPGSKVKGGDLGWFEKGRMVPAFAEAAFAAEKGAVVGPVETRFGQHIIKVVDRRESVPLEEVRGGIEDELKKGAVEGYIEQLKQGWTYELAGAAAPAAGTPPAGAPPADAHPPGDGHDH
jgi:peptidyl-prolyl cis-trans isomerase C